MSFRTGTGYNDDYASHGNFDDVELELTLGSVQPFIQQYGSGTWLPGSQKHIGPYLFTCGASESTKFSNIYDMLGNLMEYCSTYVTADNGSGNSKRGGNFMSNGSDRAVIDWQYLPNENVAPFTGFRVTLLLTEDG